MALTNVERAKRYAEKLTGDNPLGEKRKWLVGSLPDSYESDMYRVEVEVLEGSPPRAVLVDFVRYGTCFIVTPSGHKREFRRR